MDLVDLPFGDTFSLVRGRVAPYRTADGEMASAALNVPRFDHTETGDARGLLIEAVWPPAASDICRLKRAGWSGVTTARTTVLHEYETRLGELRLRAWYGREGEAADLVDACLDTQGRHRLLAVVPGHLNNRGGFVRWRNRFFQLGGLLMADDTHALGESPAGNHLIEG